MDERFGKLRPTLGRLVALTLMAGIVVGLLARSFRGEPPLPPPNRPWY